MQIAMNETCDVERWSFSSCVSVSHSQSLQTPLHSLSTCVQWVGLLSPVYSRRGHSLIRGRSTGFCFCVIFTTLCAAGWLHNHHM